MSSFARVRKSLVNPNDVLADSAFSKTNVEDVFEYKAKESIRKNGFYQRGEVFLELPGLKSVLDKFSVKSDNAEIFIYNGNSSDTGYRLNNTYLIH